LCYSPQMLLGQERGQGRGQERGHEPGQDPGAIRDSAQANGILFLFARRHLINIEKNYIEMLFLFGLSI